MSSFRPKNQQKYCKDFCPDGFYSFLGSSWKLFGASYKKIRAEILTILVETMTQKRHFEIKWPLSIPFLLKSQKYWHIMRLSKTFNSFYGLFPSIQIFFFLNECSVCYVGRPRKIAYFFSFKVFEPLFLITNSLFQTLFDSDKGPSENLITSPV